VTTAVGDVDNEYFVVKDEKWMELMNELRAMADGSWGELGRRVRMSHRMMKKLRSTKWATVKASTVDKLLSRMDMLHRAPDLTWMTPPQLLEKGIWKPPYWEQEEWIRARDARREANRELYERYLLWKERGM